MAVADASNYGAMSSADFVKLGTIDASAQTNVIETVKVDGTALTVTDKAVNIELPDYSGTYAPLSLTGTVNDNRTAFDNYTAATDTRLDTIESGYTQSATFDAYTAATNNALTSADTRLDALEAISGDSHTHSNKAVLDGVTAEKVAAWDDAADKAHEHSNKAVLDGITAEKVSAWDGVAGSADTRLDALEAISGQSHTHENKAVLDGISAEKVSAWDAAEQNAKDYADGLKNGLNADVSGESNGVSVQVVQASGVVTDVNVTAPDFGATYAPISLTGTVADNKTAFDNYTAATDTRLNNIESSATTWNNVAGSADTRISALEAVSADTRLDALEAVSADTRLDALEALTGSTSSALQSISAADNSVTVGAKDSNNNQTVGAKISAVANNALKLESDGLFAAIYYDGDDSN
jgi:hypothetical protein